MSVEIFFDFLLFATDLEMVNQFQIPIANGRAHLAMSDREKVLYPYHIVSNIGNTMF